MKLKKMPPPRIESGNFLLWQRMSPKSEVSINAVKIFKLRHHPHIPCRICHLFMRVEVFDCLRIPTRLGHFDDGVQSAECFTAESFCSCFRCSLSEKDDQWKTKPSGVRTQAGELHHVGRSQDCLLEIMVESGTFLFSMQLA